MTHDPGDSRNGLALRVGLVIVLVEVVVLSALGHRYTSRFNAQLERHAEDQLAVLGDLMSAGLLAYEAAGDPDALSLVVEAPVIAAYLVGANGRVFFSLDRSSQGKRLSTLEHERARKLLTVAGESSSTHRFTEADAPRIASVRPILADDGRLFGHLYLEVDGTSIAIARARTARTFVVGSAICVVLTSLIILASFQQLVHRRLRRLGDVVSGIAGGRWPDRIESRPADEIGRLADGIGEMSQRLRARERELGEYRGHLEELVVERTAELERAQDELVRRERLATIGEVTGALSHELRNPLGTISASFESVRLSLGEADERTARGIARVGRNIDRCTQIIERMLEYARSPELTLRPVDMGRWLDEALHGYALPEGVTLRLEPGTGRRLVVDPARLHRLLECLVDNAVDANREAGGGAVVVATRDADGGLEIEVSDDGPGLDPEVERQMFDPLYSTKTFGVGLGLAQVQQIVRQHDGRIDYRRRRAENGSTFTVYIPALESAEPGVDGRGGRPPAGR